MLVTAVALSDDISAVPIGRAPLGHDVLDADALLEACRTRPMVERDFIARAAQVAAVAHAGQRRASGEAYVTHPIAVATVCAELGLDGDAIAAALLHDTLEDTDLTYDDLAERFSVAVADLVEGVTKIGRVHIPSDQERATANYRRLLLAMARDVRVLIIKLADRLHNLRTIDALSKDRQLRIARETLDLHAPLAHRLGIQSVRWELEDRAFAVLFPQRHADLVHMIGSERHGRERYIDAARVEVAAALERAGIVAEVTGRAKHLYSIFQTMRERDKEFNELHDLHALRVIVGSPADCYAAIGVLHAVWKPIPGRFKDYVATPKLNGYQSLHTSVIGPEGRTIEIQVRTHAMHQVAEMGVAAHWAYKERTHAPEVDEGWREAVAGLGSADLDPDALLARLRAELGEEEEVFIFTPRGDLKALPRGATPVDFAYAVHTDVGHRCVGAKVNGHLTPLSQTLETGDFVEILTSRTGADPQEQWLDFIVTSRARAAILGHHRRERREDVIERGRSIVDSALAAQALTPSRADTLRAELVRESGSERAEGLYLGVGEGHVSEVHLERMICRRLRREAPAPGQRTAEELGVIVVGDPGVHAHMALCCTPLPGDPLLGCRLHDGGVSVHHALCPNARRRAARAPERIVALEWGEEQAGAVRVEISILATDRTRLLEEMAAAIAEQGANIITAFAQGDGSLVRARFVLELARSDQLPRLLIALRTVESVVDVHRVTPRGPDASSSTE